MTEDDLKELFVHQLELFDEVRWQLLTMKVCLHRLGVSRDDYARLLELVRAEISVMDQTGRSDELDQLRRLFDLELPD
jgi:hypothetical protein